MSSRSPVCVRLDLDIYRHFVSSCRARSIMPGKMLESLIANWTPLPGEAALLPDQVAVLFHFSRIAGTSDPQLMLDFVTTHSDDYFLFEDFCKNVGAVE